MIFSTTSCASVCTSTPIGVTTRVPVPASVSTFMEFPGNSTCLPIIDTASMDWPRSTWLLMVCMTDFRSWMPCTVEICANCEVNSVVVHRVERILVVHLRDQQRQELVLQRLGAASAARRSRAGAGVCCCDVAGGGRAKLRCLSWMPRIGGPAGFIGRSSGVFSIKVLAVFSTSTLAW